MSHEWGFSVHDLRLSCQSLGLVPGQKEFVRADGNVRGM